MGRTRSGSDATPPRRRRSRWSLFGRRGNRRVRLTSGAALPRPSGDTSRALADAWKRARRPLVVAGAALLAVGGVVAAHQLVTRSSHFAVRAVRVVPAPRHASEESLITRAAVPSGVNLFTLDLDAVAACVAEDPWVARVKARRELPSTVALDVEERIPAAVVALGALYLADPMGAVFKRATPDEAARFPIITGLDRDRFLDEPERARADIREALAVIAAWQANPTRPAIGEVHLDRAVGLTAYTTTGVAVRLGRAGTESPTALAARLARFDRVWASLAQSNERPRLIYLDNRARPDRVTVKLAAPTPSSPAKAPSNSEI
jgi:cell division protein FtsQ